MIVIHTLGRDLQRKELKAFGIFSTYRTVFISWLKSAQVTLQVYATAAVTLVDIVRDRVSSLLGSREQIE